MRKLMYFTLGFGTAIAACAYVKEDIWKYLLAAGILLLLCRIGQKRLFFRRVLLALWGCVLGFIWFSQFCGWYLGPVLPLDKKIVPLAVRASDYGEADCGFTFTDGTVEFYGKTYQIQVRLDGNMELRPGDQIAGRFYLRVIDTGVRPGQGIFMAAYQEGTVTIGKTEECWWDRIVHYRREIRTIIEETFPEDTFAFAKALLIGDTSDLSYEIDTAMKVSGVRHVVAVSGLHISILFGLLSMVTFRKRFLMALVGYPLLFFFAAITGFTPSVDRSCIMWGLVLLAKLSDDEYDGPTSLSFAILVMLLFNPMVITSVSFQLSVASVAGIYLFRDSIFLFFQSFFGDQKNKRIWSLLVRWFCNSVSITISAGILTTPLCAYYFGMVSLVGVITNLLSLWVVSGIFYGVMAVILLHFTAPMAATAFAGFVSWPIRYVLWVAKSMAAFPLAAVYTSSVYILSWLLYVYVLLLLYLASYNKRTQLLWCCITLGLCAALTADWTEALLSDVRITVLDVGQGQSILLQSEGKSFLVDCGGDTEGEAADQAAEALLVQGIDRLDGLILTHLDSDHAGDAEALLSRIETELLILPKEYTDLPEKTDAQLICAAEPLKITFEDTLITVYPATFPGNSNEKSLCVLFDTEKCDILITGDRDGFGERSLLRNAKIPEVDVLIAGHHGAASSTCEELLEAVKPEIVCISVGENYYGHPAPELLNRLAAFGCDVYRTDVQGTITIRR